MSADFIPRALERLRVAGKSGDWWSAECILCPEEHADAKLGINFQTRWVSCFRCHTSLPLRVFLKNHLGYPEEEIEELMSVESLIEVKRHKPRKLPFFPWEDAFSEVSSSEACWMYLMEREVPQETVEKYRIRFADPRPNDSRIWRRKLVNRVMIPTIENDRVVYFVGRDILGTQTPRYYNPPNIVSPRVAHNTLFNLERAALGEVVILVEGVFDAIRCGESAVASFGKRLHFSQALALAKKKVKEVCILPDNKGLDPGDITAMVDALWEHEIKTSLATLPGSYKDAGDSPAGVIKKAVENRIVIGRNEYFEIAAGRFPRRSG